MFFFITQLFVFLIILLNFVDNSIIMTKNGAIKGKLVYSYGVLYYSFQGIPYAESPTSSLRFKPPVPKKNWNNILNATKEGPVCPQLEGRYSKWQMNEDCLFLNIYVPAIKVEEKLSVLVFIHGGALKSLSGNSDLIYGPEMFLHRNIIFATMNHRLGALGFLSLGLPEASGNAGLKDVVLALKWIKENIDRFGGDPNRITLGGHSSGAAVVHFLMLTTTSTGLFQQALLISGSALTYRFMTRNQKAMANILAERLALPTNNTYELLERLKSLNPFDIVEAQSSLFQIAQKKYFVEATFVPCIEKEHPDAFLTRDPRQIIISGIPQNVPVLAGTNSREGIYFMTKDFNFTNDPLENLDVTIPHDIQYPRFSKERLSLIKSINEFYFINNTSSNDTFSKFLDVITDTQFTIGVDNWIKLHKQNKKSNKVYYYNFDFDDELNWAKVNYNLTMDGTSHGDELGYIFVTKRTKGKLIKMNARCKRIIDVLMTHFINFINFGDPTPTNQNITTKWPECTEDRNHFILSEQPKSVPYAAFAERFKFWNDIYEQYYQYVEDGRPLEIIVL